MASNKLPEIGDEKQTGNLAVSYIGTLFEENGWIFRRADGTTDFGIDAEVEIVDNNLVTGKMFKCQIKGTKLTDFSKGAELVQVKVSTWNNWKNVNMPVIALLCDIVTKKIFWSLPLAFEPQKNATSVGLKFEASNCLTESFSEFNGMIKTWHDSFPKNNILLEVPYYHNMFVNELELLIDWGDPWCAVDKELNMKSRIFYAHVLELRASIGLRNDNVIPFHYWLIRNEGIWGDSLHFYYGTISELLTYLKFSYEEAIQKLKSRLEKIELSFETNELVNYFKLHPFLKSRTVQQVVFSNRLAKSEKFHKMIESNMDRLGYKKLMRWQPKG